MSSMKTIDIYKEDLQMSEKYEIILNTKNIRKISFAVGFGFVMGSKVAHIVDRAANRLLVSTMRDMAKDGNKFAQEVCNKTGLGYEVTKNENEIKGKTPIGFRA